MSARACLLVAAAALTARVTAEPVCSSASYGVLNGTAHHLPEHYLMPRLFDWAIGVPLLCPGQQMSGMEARVCSWLPAPAVRILDWGTALVHVQPWLPTYSTVNVTVYCGPQLPAPSVTPPLASNTPTSSPSPAPGSSTEDQPLNRLLRAKALRHSLLMPLWSRN